MTIVLRSSRDSPITQVHNARAVRSAASSQTHPRRWRRRPARSVRLAPLPQRAEVFAITSTAPWHSHRFRAGTSTRTGLWCEHDDATGPSAKAAITASPPGSKVEHETGRRLDSQRSHEGPVGGIEVDVDGEPTTEEPDDKRTVDEPRTNNRVSDGRRIDGARKNCSAPRPRYAGARRPMLHRASMPVSRRRSMKSTTNRSHSSVGGPPQPRDFRGIARSGSD